MLNILNSCPITQNSLFQTKAREVQVTDKMFHVKHLQQSTMTRAATWQLASQKALTQVDSQYCLMRYAPKILSTEPNQL